MVGILRRHGYPPPQVNFLGKAATFNLMYAFPCYYSVTEVDGWRPWPRFRMGVRRMGYNPLLVGRSPVRGAGPQVVRADAMAD